MHPAFIAALAAVLLANAAPARADAPPAQRFLVVTIAADDTAPSAADAVTEAMRGLLRGREHSELVTAARTAPADCLAAPTCIEGLASEARADVVISGEVSAHEDGHRVLLRLFDAWQGALRGTEEAKLSSLTLARLSLEPALRRLLTRAPPAVRIAPSEASDEGDRQWIGVCLGAGVVAAALLAVVGLGACAVSVGEKAAEDASAACAQNLCSAPLASLEGCTSDVTGCFDSGAEGCRSLTSLGEGCLAASSDCGSLSNQCASAGGSCAVPVRATSAPSGSAMRPATHPWLFAPLPPSHDGMAY